MTSSVYPSGLDTGTSIMDSYYPLLADFGFVSSKK